MTEVLPFLDHDISFAASGDLTEPTTQQREDGFELGSQIPRQILNWRWNSISELIEWCKANSIRTFDSPASAVLDGSLGTDALFAIENSDTYDTAATEVIANLGEKRFCTDGVYLYVFDATGISKRRLDTLAEVDSASFSFPVAITSLWADTNGKFLLIYSSSYASEIGWFFRCSDLYHYGTILDGGWGSGIRRATMGGAWGSEQDYAWFTYGANNFHFCAPDGSNSVKATLTAGQAVTDVRQTATNKFIVATAESSPDWLTRKVHRIETTTTVETQISYVGSGVSGERNGLLTSDGKNFFFGFGFLNDTSNDGCLYAKGCCHGALSDDGGSGSIFPDRTTTPISGAMWQGGSETDNTGKVVFIDMCQAGVFFGLYAVNSVLVNPSTGATIKAFSDIVGCLENEICLTGTDILYRKLSGGVYSLKRQPLGTASGLWIYTDVTSPSRRQTSRLVRRLEY